MNTTVLANSPRSAHRPAGAPAITPGTRLRRTAGGMALALLTAVLGYLVLRPSLLRWGATDAEVAATLPGDLAGLRWTRAVAIDATPHEIWPWLVQWGQGRGGWYSYDWLENLFGFDIHSADHILAEHQDLAVGDPICLAGGVCFMNVVKIEPERRLVLQGSEPSGTPFWTFALDLQPISETQTRLVLRESFRPDALPAAALYALEFADVIMEQKSLDTIKNRAEGVAPSTLVSAVEIGAWLGALVIALTAGVICLTRRDWLLPLTLGLVAVLVLVALTFLFPPLWLRAMLDVALLAGVAWAWRRPDLAGRPGIQE